MKLKKTDKAVSSVVGTMLLLSMTILLFSIICGIVLSYPSSPSTPSANLVGMIEEDHQSNEYYLLIEHRGGKALSLKTKITLAFDNANPESIIIGNENYLNNEAKKDNKWGLGEWLIYEIQNKNLAGNQIEITVVDLESNSVVMTGMLQGT